MTISAQTAAPASWLGRLGRRLEDNHALFAGVLLVVLAALLGHATVSTFSKGPYDVDGASVQIAAQMLGVEGATSAQIGAPGYPLVLYAMAQTDPKVKAAIACRASGVACGAEGSFRSLVALQFGLVVASLFLVFVLALRLSGLWEAALMALLLTCLESRMGEFAGGISQLSWMTALTLLYSILALETYLRGSAVFALGAGVAVGTATLFAPLTAAVVPALAIVLGLARRPPMGRTRAALVLALLGGLLLAAGLGVAAWSASYDPEAAARFLTLKLAERIGFEGMSPVAWLAGLILPIPFLGGWLEFLFPESVASALAHGYAATGRDTVFPRALAQPGSALDQYWWLLKTHILEAAGPYLVVTPPHPQSRDVGRGRHRGAHRDFQHPEAGLASNDP